MSDAWLEDMHDASFGGLAIDIISISEAFPRQLVVTEYVNRDGAKVVHARKGPRSTDVQVVFHQNSIRRMKQFLALCDGTPRTFIDPLTGAYTALAGDIDVAASARSRDFIELSTTFTESTLDVSPIEVEGDPVGQSEAALADVLNVFAASSVSLDPDLEADPNTTMSVTDDAAEFFDFLKSSQATQRAASLRVSALNNRIEDEIDRLELLTDVRNYPLMIAMRRLQSSARRLAESAVSTSEQITTFTVESPRSLASLMADLYGAEAVTERHREVLELNDIRNPARLEAGSILRVYQS